MYNPLSSFTRRVTAPGSCLTLVKTFKSPSGAEGAFVKYADERKDIVHVFNVKTDGEMSIRKIENGDKQNPTKIIKMNLKPGEVTANTIFDAYFGR